MNKKMLLLYFHKFHLYGEREMCVCVYIYEKGEKKDACALSLIAAAVVVIYDCVFMGKNYNFCELPKMIHK